MAIFVENAHSIENSEDNSAFANKMINSGLPLVFTYDMDLDIKNISFYNENEKTIRWFNVNDHELKASNGTRVWQTNEFLNTGIIKDTLTLSLTNSDPFGSVSDITLCSPHLRFHKHSTNKKLHEIVLNTATREHGLDGLIEPKQLNDGNEHIIMESAKLTYNTLETYYGHYQTNFFGCNTSYLAQYTLTSTETAGAISRAALTYLYDNNNCSFDPIVDIKQDPKTGIISAYRMKNPTYISVTAIDDDEYAYYRTHIEFHRGGYPNEYRNVSNYDRPGTGFSLTGEGGISIYKSIDGGMIDFNSNPLIAIDGSNFAWKSHTHSYIKSIKSVISSIPTIDELRNLGSGRGVVNFISVGNLNTNINNLTVSSDGINPHLYMSLSYTRKQQNPTETNPWYALALAGDQILFNTIKSENGFENWKSIAFKDDIAVTNVTQNTASPENSGQTFSAVSQVEYSNKQLNILTKNYTLPSIKLTNANATENYAGGNHAWYNDGEATLCGIQRFFKNTGRTSTDWNEIAYSDIDVPITSVRISNLSVNDNVVSFGNTDGVKAIKYGTSWQFGGDGSSMYFRNGSTGAWNNLIYSASTDNDGDYGPVKRIVVVNALPSDAASHKDTLYLVTGTN